MKKIKSNISKNLKDDLIEVPLQQAKKAFPINDVIKTSSKTIDSKRFKKLNLPIHSVIDLGTFSTSYMIEEAQAVFNYYTPINAISWDARSEIEKAKDCCSEFILDLLGASKSKDYKSFTTTGSSEAVFLAVLLLKRYWQSRHQSTKGRLNLIIGSDIRGRVTMFLKEVDVKEAFEIILAANGLASERRGDILYVMTQKDYELLYGQKYGDKREAKMIQLKYAKAALVGELLNQLKTNIGKVLIDESSNSVIIIDTPGAVSQAIEFIARLDKPTETLVFELNYAKADVIKVKIEEVLTKGVGRLQIDERTNKIIVTLIIPYNIVKR